MKRTDGLEQRVGLLNEWLAARDEFAQLAVLAEAVRYDRAHPGEDSLVTELIATAAGDQYEAVA